MPVCFRFLLLQLLLLPGCCWGIQCYQCGSISDGLEAGLPCELFIKAPMWRPFEVECPSSPPHYCAKALTHSHDDDQPREMRGCAPAENAFQVPNAVGCGRANPLSPTVFCLCDSNHCNKALSTHHSSLTILFFTFTLLLCLYSAIQ